MGMEHEGGVQFVFSCSWVKEMISGRGVARVVGMPPGIECPLLMNKLVALEVWKLLHLADG